ncbi:putative Acidic mammalian chitinase [Hypsibius exemplaris]|uniref:Metalloendopeptidase n=1 Tax=Hypsibius exemplaris TaxID=2072580 RepID=A0A9X6NFJ3_HYPEX|nr:putative Acidic mammalian chitinase [Hypsibius exemplaris]
MWTDIIFILVVFKEASARSAYIINAATAVDDSELAAPADASFFQGDIIGIDTLPDSDSTSMGLNGVLDENLKWKTLKVPYAYSQTFLSSDQADKRQIISDAMDVFEKNTCLTFVQRTTETEFITIFADANRCYSYYGKQQPRPKGQPVALSLTNCFTNGTSGIAQHELMHTLGFFHEQSRMDRDNYVDINWNNIMPEAQSQFIIQNSTAFDEPYDFDSVLHYGMFDFAIDRSIWTIKPKEKYKDKQIGQRIGLSPTDIRKINKMYKCPPRAITPSSPGPSDPQFDSPHRGCYYSLAGESRRGLGKFTVSDVDATLCTYITVAFGTVQNDRLQVSSALKETLDKLKAVRDGSGTNLKIFLSVGGQATSNALDDIARDKAKSHAFARAAAQVLRSSGLDGLDIMYQKQSGVDSGKFTAFIQEIQRTFSIESYENDAIRLAISLVVFSEPSMTASIDAKSLDSYVDIVHVAAYGFSGSDRKSVSHHSPTTLGTVGFQQLYNMKTLLENWRKRGFSKSKLVAGLPFYGRGWLLEDPANHDLGSGALRWIASSAFTSEQGAWPYYEICQRINQDDATNVFDPDIQASYAYNDAWWIGYNDIQTIKTKANWARQNGYGVYAWDISEDDFGNNCGGGKNPLLTAIKEAMGQ